VLYEQVVGAVANIDILYERWRAVVYLAPNLPDSLVGRVLEIAAATFPVPRAWRTAALSSLIPRMSEAERFRVLRFMLEEVLTPLGPYESPGNSLSVLIKNLRVNERQALLEGRTLDAGYSAEAGFVHEHAAWQYALSGLASSGRTELWRKLF